MVVKYYHSSILARVLRLGLPPVGLVIIMVKTYLWVVNSTDPVQ